MCVCVIVRFYVGLSFRDKSGVGGTECRICLSLDDCLFFLGVLMGGVCEGHLVMVQGL